MQALCTTIYPESARTALFPAKSAVKLPRMRNCLPVPETRAIFDSPAKFGRNHNATYLTQAQNAYPATRPVPRDETTVNMRMKNNEPYILVQCSSTSPWSK